MTTFEESEREETNADDSEGEPADEPDATDAQEGATDTSSSEQSPTEPSSTEQSPTESSSTESSQTTESDSATTGKAASATDGETESEVPEPTPQSEELRRQQYAVGVGAAIIAGFALAISSMQHFPSLHEAVPIVAGFVGAGLVYWIVQNSLYPTEEEIATGE